MPKKLLIKDIFHHRGTKCPGHTRSRPHGGTRGKARFWPSNSCGDGRHWHMKMPVWLDRLNIWWFPLLKKCKLVVFAGSVNWELSVFRFEPICLQWQNGSQYIYLNTVFKYKFEVPLLYSSISIFCYFILPLNYILEANFVVFTPQHLFDNFSC